jgi:ABC-2 type transport system ATP-binding protein
MPAISSDGHAGGGDRLDRADSVALDARNLHQPAERGGQDHDDADDPRARRPTAGSVTVNGKPFAQLFSAMREVGALLDAKAVHGGRSAYKHLLCLAQTNRIARRRVDDVIGLVGLADVAGKRSKGFSLGMSQRLGIAAALLGDPEILMFDEPVNGLDPEGIRWIRLLMRSLAAEGRTVFVSSHLMSEMENTADHLIVIGRGKLIAESTEFEARAEG